MPDETLPKSAFYPAPGNRNANYGTLYNVGNYGYSWASSFTGTIAYRLHFVSGAVYPNDNSGRANGLQLRCLQE